MADSCGSTGLDVRRRKWRDSATATGIVQTGAASQQDMQGFHGLLIVHQKAADQPAVFLIVLIGLPGKSSQRKHQFLYVGASRGTLLKTMSILSQAKASQRRIALCTRRVQSVVGTLFSCGDGGQRIKLGAIAQNGVFFLQQGDQILQQPDFMCQGVSQRLATRPTRPG